MLGAMDAPQNKLFVTKVLPKHITAITTTTTTTTIIIIIVIIIVIILESYNFLTQVISLLFGEVNP